jgi:hypothetical protein
VAQFNSFRIAAGASFLFSFLFFFFADEIVTVTENFDSKSGKFQGNCLYWESAGKARLPVSRRPANSAENFSPYLTGFL